MGLVVSPVSFKSSEDPEAHRGHEVSVRLDKVLSDVTAEGREGSHFVFAPVVPLFLARNEQPFFSPTPD